MSDLVETLREHMNWIIEDDGTEYCLNCKAADEIERLRKALEFYADVTNHTVSADSNEHGAPPVDVDMGKLARDTLASLKGEKDNQDE